MTEPQPTLMLLHGLGATGEVWNPLINVAAWPGRVLAPDLRGHGSSNWTDSYSFGEMAADVATLLSSNEDYVVLGHSMGGAVGAALATGFFGHLPRAVGMIGVKLQWSEEELRRLPNIAAKPSRLFDTRGDAIEWFLKLSGLAGVLEPDDSSLERGVERTEQGWRVRQDPKSVLVVTGSPPFSELLNGLSAPISLALGEHDPLVAPEHHNDLPCAPPRVFKGLGHNAMVEDPAMVWDWFLEVTNRI